MEVNLTDNEFKTIIEALSDSYIDSLQGCDYFTDMSDSEYKSLHWIGKLSRIERIEKCRQTAEACKSLLVRFNAF